MDRDLPLFPDAASTVAGPTDALYLFLVVVTAVMSIGIFSTITWFAIRYRRQAGRTHSPAMKTPIAVEAAWIAIPLIVVMIMFAWGAKLFYDNHRIPADTLDIYVVGKQWMWKIRHPGGRGEINELHVPVRRPVKLIMTSQDVIHSFYVPAFRIKQDVLPGRYTAMWFEALRPGRYHLFCAEYCGTSHSEMRGTVIAMEPEDYQEWLAAGQTGVATTRGEALYARMRCDDCHRDDAARGDQPRAPGLRGLLGREITLRDGTTIVADETYFRASLFDPGAALVAGYDPIMPTYRGLLSEEDVADLLEYVRGLTPAARPATKPTEEPR